MSAFIINVLNNNFSIAGFVLNAAIAAEKANGALVVAKAEDLEQALSNQQLTELYNAITGEEKSVFKTAKSESAAKVYAALEALDTSTLVQLDKTEEGKVEGQAAQLAAEPKVRKVRNSKLQRMAAAFKTKEGDAYKQWTIKELMEHCGTAEDPMSERIAHVYISILRSSTDRFQLTINKDKETGKFQLAVFEAATA